MPRDMTGAIIAGKYRCESLIGRGGMGSVWRAQHLGLHAPVAVKLMDVQSFEGNPEALQRFQREAFAAASIRSEHVVQIFDCGFDETFRVPFIVMELMNGESLAHRITRTGPLSPEQAARVFTHVARALTRAHEAGIVHRDLKPDNVFLVRNEDEEIAKVLDFGIARTQSHEIGEASTVTGTVMGTAYYMSPEQISGSKHVDYRTDLWAFGVMACECLTGVRPYQADSIGGLALCICVGPTPVPSTLGRVPPGFDAWFARCVQHAPDQRFQSAREAAEALRAVCGAPDTQRSVSPSGGGGTQVSAGVSAAAVVTVSPLSVSSAPRTAKRSKVGWVAIGVGLVCVVGALGVRFVRSPRSSVAPPASQSVARISAAPSSPSIHAESERAPPSSVPVTPPWAASAPSAQSSALPPPVPAVPPGPKLGGGWSSSPQAAPPKVVAPRVTPKPLRDVAKSAPAAPAPTRDVIDDRR